MPPELVVFDFALQELSAFFFVSVIGYSLTEGAGRPGWPVLVILHWQVYSRVQEEAENRINKAAAAVKKDVERFFIE